MCGIAGLFRWRGRRGDDASRVEAMTRALSHRGPDDHGVLDTGTGLVLGHTRLSILDLSAAAAQPMSAADGRYTLTYNGELYDFRALRRQLEAEGETFTSHGDTEVLLRALVRHGEGALRMIDGMFAFAFFDASERRLMLARDRAGKKPLFVAEEGDAVIFASELGALRAAGVALTLDPETLPEFLVRGYVPPPRTLCRGVSQLGPGELMTVAGNGRSTRRRHWEHPWLRDGAPPVIHRDAATAAAEIQRLFVAAVSRRLVSDVPLGAFLSGGVDSAAVVAAAQRASSTPLQTFTIGFSDAPGWDERDAARETARILGTRHVERVASPDVMELLPWLVTRTGEPQGDSSFVPTHLVSKLAREHVTVALSGDGGDELYAGYDRFLLALMAAQLPRRAASSLARWFAHAEEGPAARRVTRALKRWTRAASIGPGATLMEWAGGTRVEDVERLLGLALDPRRLAQPEDEAIARARGRGAPDLQAALAANFVTYLPGNTLVKLDRASMSNSLEVRSPFLDTALVEHAATLAPWLLARGRSLKWILKSALADLVPAEVRARKKSGFGAPVGDWFRGASGASVRGILTSPGGALAAHVSPRAVDDLLRAHADRSAEHGILLSRLLALSVWLAWSVGSTHEPAPAIARGAVAC